jgi:hypothetical protein
MRYSSAKFQRKGSFELFSLELVIELIMNRGGLICVANGLGLLKKKTKGLVVLFPSVFPGRKRARGGGRRAGKPKAKAETGLPPDRQGKRRALSS